jgi:hypothetical protein
LVRHFFRFVHYVYIIDGSVHTESDWVVSNELVAMALTHMAQSISNQVVLAELFDFDGSEVYLKDHRYIYNI